MRMFEESSQQFIPEPKRFVKGAARTLVVAKAPDSRSIVSGQSGSFNDETSATRSSESRLPRYLKPP
jgi:hypothetical protein